MQQVSAACWDYAHNWYNANEKQATKYGQATSLSDCIREYKDANPVQWEQHVKTCRDNNEYNTKHLQNAMCGLEYSEVQKDSTSILNFVTQKLASGLSLRQISVLLDLPYETLKKRLQRASGTRGHRVSKASVPQALLPP